MNEQQLDKWFKTLADGLTTLMGKMQMSAEKLFEWGMKANYAHAASDLFIALLTAVVLFSIWKMIFKFKEELQEDDWYDVVVMFSCIITAIGLIIFTVSSHFCMMRLIAPEMMTLGDFVRMVK